MSRRRAAAVIAAVVAISILGLPGPIRAARGVPPTVEASVSLPDAAVASAGRAHDVELPIRPNLVALSFRTPLDRAEQAEILVRARTESGWGDWTDAHVNLDEAPDLSAPEGGDGRIYTEPIWVGTARELEVRLEEGPSLADLRVHLINSKGDAEPRNPVVRALGAIGAFLAGTPRPPTAEARPRRPGIITRAQWGADESWRTPGPGIADELRMAFVHHTAGSNSYSKSESDDVVRAIYRYHTRTKGWSDVAYNFLVDRYGQIFEGRYGGIDKAVIGGHAMGFNRYTTGVALMGTFSSVAPPSGMLSSLEKLLAWKLDIHHVPPVGKVTMTSGGSYKYPEGTSVSLNRISGHRDAQATSCPGAETYGRLPRIRSNVEATGNPKIYLPGTNVSVLRPDGDGSNDGVRVRAGVSRSARWRVRLYDPAGILRSTADGSGQDVHAVWYGRLDGGSPAPTGVYTWRIDAWNSVAGATPATGTLPVVTLHPDGTLLFDGTNRYLVEDFSSRAVGAVQYASHYGSAGQVATGPGERGRYDAGSALDLRDGTLLQSPDGKRHIVSEGKRRTFAPESTFGGLGYREEAVVHVAQSVVDALPAGTDVSTATAHPVGAAVSDAGGVYWLITAGAKRPMISLAARSRYRSAEIVASTAADDALPPGEAVPVRDGTLIRSSDGSPHWIVTGGTRRRFHSSALFSAMGYSESMLLSASASDLSAVPLGSTLRIVFRPPFVDDEGSIHEADIVRIAAGGITAGCATELFCPGRSVPRWQMAVFIARALAGGESSIPSAGTVGSQPYSCGAGGVSRFSDVSAGASFCKHVHYLASLQVTGGCDASRYCPAARVVRSQMAMFLARALAGGESAVPGSGSVSAQPYTCSSGGMSVFGDVSPSASFCPHVHYIAAQGVTGGCSADRFCPDPSVTRAQMASFLARGFL